MDVVRVEQASPNLINWKNITFWLIGGIFSVFASIMTFSLSVYPSLATEKYVKEYVKENAPYLEDRKLFIYRLGKLEESVKSIGDDIVRIREHQQAQTSKAMVFND